MAVLKLPRPACWNEGLATRLIGRRLVYFDRVDSTSVQAMRLAEHGEPEGTVVLADEQLAGHGRMGRTWHSAPGLGIWMSLILYPEQTVRAARLLPQIACAAVAKALLHWTDGVGIKWPNDLLLGGRKVCGILTEGGETNGRVSRAVLGIGINVNHQKADFPPMGDNTATSLRLALGRPVARAELFCNVLEAFEPLYLEWKATRKSEETLRLCRRYSCVIGRPVRLIRQGTECGASVLGLDEQGGLIVRYENGDSGIVQAGELSLRLV